MLIWIDAEFHSESNGENRFKPSQSQYERSNMMTVWFIDVLWGGDNFMANELWNH
jgi:hypothetical protein